MAEIILSVGMFSVALFIGGKVLSVLGRLCGLNELVNVIGDSFIVSSGTFTSKR